MKRQSKRPASSHESTETGEIKPAFGDQDEVLAARNMEHGDEAELDDVDDDDDELAGGRAAARSAGGLGEKKRRLALDQVRALERCFETDNKLDPDRKSRIAGDLGLQPRQVAVWFQNRRARWKTKALERDFAALRARHDALRADCDALRRDKDALAAEIRELRDKVEKQMDVKLESAEELMPASAGTAAAGAAAGGAVYKDGSTDSDSSAVFNEEASPYSGVAFDHHHHQPHPSFTGFTSFLTSSSSLGSSFPSLYHGPGSHLEQEADGFLSAGATAAAAGFFAEEQGSWYGSEGW